MTHAFPAIRFAAAIALAGALLTLYNARRIDTENIGRDMANQTTVETWNAERLNAHSIEDIKNLIASRSDSTSQKKRRASLLWLGNSQMHTINQYRKGDHLGPYWLAQSMACDKCPLPIGISLPNASLQEHLAVSQMTLSRVPVALILLKLVFDDLRESGLRTELHEALSQEDKSAIAESRVGREILEAAATPSQVAATPGGPLEGFVQRYIEDWIVDKLNSVIPLWAERANLRNRLMVDLYVTRNALLGIKPSSIRSMIKSRYDRNMDALIELAAIARKKRIPLLVYVAPIRQDLPLPYDRTAYADWKSDLFKLAYDHGFSAVDFDTLVPSGQWGEIVKDEADYMHFQGAGHKLLADALAPHVARALAQGSSARP